MAGTTTYYGISYPTSTDYVKDGATAMQTIATGFDTAVAIPVYNNQTGTSYTFVLADAAKVVSSNNASGVTFTIPPQSSVAWATGTTLTVINYGAGDLTVAGGSGVTVTNASSTVAQYRGASIIRTASDAWTLVPLGGGASPIPVSYVVVGGGGGGGCVNDGGLSVGGGGGGAGGYLSGSLDIVKGTNYQVIVGAGGSASFQWQTNGGMSQFFSAAAAGGGEGGSLPAAQYRLPSSGGSGGGGCQGGGASGITGQGNNGGAGGNSGSQGSGGGGGGATAVGGNGTGGVSGSFGAGGAGASSSITGSSVTRAVGGNGGRSDFTYNGSSASANTGNGGDGGGLYAGGNSAGGNGGSGIVILSYPSILTITASVGLTTSTSTVGSNKVTQITAGVGTVSFN